MKFPAWFAAPVLSLLAAAGLTGAEPYRSPLSIAVAPDDATLYAIDRTAGCVAILDRAAGKWAADVPLGGEPWARRSRPTARRSMCRNVSRAQWR